MAEGYGTGLLVVSSAAAGGTDDERVDIALDVLRKEHDVRLVPCRHEGDLERALDARGDRMVVVAGGDGSVHLAVAALLARDELDPDQPLGLLPLGTGNDLARTLGVPLDPAAAARALCAGRPRRLDLFLDDAGGVVVNAVHLGIGAEAAERASALKDRLGKAAYAVGSVSAGAAATGWSLRVEVDGTPLAVDGDVLMVAVANGRTIGGGAVLAPGAEPDDGLADVVVATSTGPLARLGFAVALREGEHVERDDVTTARAKIVTVTGEEFPVNADGELDGPVSARTWTVRPAAWSVLVSEADAATSSDGSG